MKPLIKCILHILFQNESQIKWHPRIRVVRSKIPKCNLILNQHIHQKIWLLFACITLHYLEWTLSWILYSTVSRPLQRSFLWMRARHYAYMNRNIALSTQRQHTTRLGDWPIECYKLSRLLLNTLLRCVLLHAIYTRSTWFPVVYWHWFVQQQKIKCVQNFRVFWKIIFLLLLNSHF